MVTDPFRPSSCNTKNCDHTVLIDRLRLTKSIKPFYLVHVRGNDNLNKNTNDETIFLVENICFTRMREAVGSNLLLLLLLLVFRISTSRLTERVGRGGHRYVFALSRDYCARVASGCPLICLLFYNKRRKRGGSH